MLQALKLCANKGQERQGQGCYPKQADYEIQGGVDLVLAEGTRAYKAQKSQIASRNGNVGPAKSKNPGSGVSNTEKEGRRDCQTEKEDYDHRIVDEPSNCSGQEIRI